MKIKINNLCNVVTENDATGYVPSGKRHPRPQITAPAFRMRLNIVEAIDLRDALDDAVKQAQHYEKLWCNTKLEGDETNNETRSVVATIRGEVPNNITDLVDVLAWIREHGEVKAHIDDNERTGGNQ